MKLRILSLLLLLVMLAPSAFAQLAQCTVTGTLYKPDATVCASCQIKIVKTYKNGALISITPITVTSNGSGVISFTVPRGSITWLSGNVIGFSQCGNQGCPVSIPDASSATLEMLVPSPTTLPNSYPVAVSGKIAVKSANASVSTAVDTLDFGSGFTLTESPTGEVNVSLTSAGTVTSVALSLPNIFSVSGSPVTASGTLAATLANQNANLVFAGPGTGAAAAPTFRALVAADLPDLSAVYSPAAHTHSFASLTSKPTTLSGYGITDAQALDADLTAIAGIAGTSGLLRKTAADTWTLDTATYLTANQTITLSGDVTGSGTTAITATVANNAITNAKLATIATATFKGRTTAGTGNVEDLTATQATALLDVFTSGTKGLAPASGGGTTNFLRADGTWAAPAGGGANPAGSGSELNARLDGTTFQAVTGSSTANGGIALVSQSATQISASLSGAASASVPVQVIQLGATPTATGTALNVLQSDSTPVASLGSQTANQLFSIQAGNRVNGDYGAPSVRSLFQIYHAQGNTSESTFVGFDAGSLSYSPTVNGKQFYGGRFFPVVPSTNSANLSAVYGAFFGPDVYGSGTVTTLVGVAAYAYGEGSRTYSNIYGADIGGFLYQTGIATNIYGTRIYLGNYSSGTATAGTVLQIDAKQGSGPVTTFKAINIADISSSGTTAWALFSAGGNSSHVGNFKLGANTTPNAKLDVEQTSASGIAGLFRSAASATAATLVARLGATPGTGGDAFQVQNSSSSVIASINSSGDFVAISGRRFSWATGTYATSSTDGHFDIQSANSPTVQVNVDATAYQQSGNFHSRAALGTPASPAALTANYIIGGIGGRPYDGTSFVSSSPAAIHFVTGDSTLSSTNHGSWIRFLTTPVGSTTGSRVDRMKIDTTGYVGIGNFGTANDPETVLHIDSTGNAGAAGSASMLIDGAVNKERFELRTYETGGTIGQAPVFQAKWIGGTKSSPTATLANAFIFGLGGSGHDGSAVVTGNKALIGFKAAENWSGSAQGTYMTLETTPTGSTTRSERARLDPSGNLLLGTTSAGASAVAALTIANGTAPTGNVTDANQLYSADAAAGDSQFYTRNEAGKIERHTGLTTYVTSQFDKTSDTTLANVPGLSHNVEAGRTYAIEAVCFTTSNSAGGIKFSVAGTATATATRFEGLSMQTTSVAQTTATSLGTTVGALGAVTTATGYLRGYITVNTAGTLTIQFAQNSSNASASSVLVGSYFKLIPIS